MTRLDLAILFRYFQLKTQDSLILDAGCGSGRLSNVYALLGGRVIGVDISRARLHLAQEGERINGTHRASFIQADLEWLPFRAESFDGIISLGTFEYVDKPRKILSESYFALRANGKLLFTVHNQHGLLKKAKKAFRPSAVSGSRVSGILVDWSFAEIFALKHEKFEFKIEGYNLSRMISSVSIRGHVFREIFSPLQRIILQISRNLESSLLGKFVCTELLIVARKSNDKSQLEGLVE